MQRLIGGGVYKFFRSLTRILLINELMEWNVMCEWAKLRKALLIEYSQPAEFTSQSDLKQGQHYWPGPIVG